MPRTDSSAPHYCTLHEAAWNDARVTNLDGDADYQADTSTDGGRTWTADPRMGTVCGGHVQNQIVGALLDGAHVTASGPVRTITEPDGSLTRWSPTA